MEKLIRKRVSISCIDHDAVKTLEITGYGELGKRSYKDVEAYKGERNTDITMLIMTPKSSL